MRTPRLALPLAAPVVKQATPSPTSRIFDPSRYLGQGNAYNCADFASEANAQAVLRADPLDPDRLDADKDGIACETNMGARDVVRAPR